jgi:hypothetical protein
VGVEEDNGALGVLHRPTGDDPTRHAEIICLTKREREQRYTRDDHENAGAGRNSVSHSPPVRKEIKNHANHNRHDDHEEPLLERRILHTTILLTARQ